MVDPLLDNLHHHKTNTVSGIRYIGSPSEAHRKGVNAKKTAGSEHGMGQKWKLSLLPCSMASCLPVNITLKKPSCFKYLVEFTRIQIAPPIKQNIT